MNKALKCEHYYLTEGEREWQKINVKNITPTPTAIYF